MFSFFATLFSAVWIAEHWQTIALVLVALIALIVFYRRSKKKAAAQYAQAIRQREEERQKEIEQKRQEEKQKCDLESRQKYNQKEAEIESAIQNCPGSEAYRLEKYQSETTSHLLGLTEFKTAAKSGYVVFDTETTGLSYASDSIVELAAVRVDGDRIVAEYHSLVNPCRPMPEESSSVNHITDAMLADQPKIHEVLPGFLSFVGDSVLVAHNARFDEGFISQACMRNRFKAPDRYFDTMNFAKYYPEAKNKKQETLLRCAGIVNEEAHRALGDARALAQFVIITLPLVGKRAPKKD